MNIKQILMLLAGTALIAVYAYTSLSGQGVQGTAEFVKVAIIGSLLAGALGGLIWAFRDPF